MGKKNIILSIVVGVVGLAVLVFLIILFTTIIPDAIKKEEQILAVKAYYENKIKLYEEENLKYDDYEVDVVFIGDSLTDGYDLNHYYGDTNLIISNRGIGGETTTGLLSRMEVSVYDLKPKVVVMLIGANNMDKMFNDYEELLKGLKENLPTTKVVILSLTAMGDEWGRKNQLAAYNNVKIEILADKYGFDFVDLFTPLLDVSTGEVYEGYTVDGGHFTPLGYEIVTSIVKPYVIKNYNSYCDTDGRN